jgi:hypothetical protein
METTNQTTGNLPAINIENFKDIVSKAPDVLTLNQNTLSNATKAGDKLFGLIEEDGMSDFYDDELAKYISKVRDAEKSMNERRRPFTQLVDHFKKMFTQAEADLKSLREQAQGLRDGYATKKMNEQRERERLAQLKLDQDKEAIELRKKVEIFLSEQVQKHVSETKNRMYNLLEASTLETIEQDRKIIANTLITFPMEEFEKLTYQFTPLFLTKDDVARIIAEVKSGDLYHTINSAHQDQLNAYKREMIDKVPSKKVELEELANASEAEAERLRVEADKRREEEAVKIAKEAEEASRKAEADANLKATAEATNAIVNAQAELQFDDASKVKAGYEITLSNTAAYIVLAQFWFEKEGKSWTADKVEKMTFARIKKFCEEHAAKTEEKIESPFVKYSEIFKAK